MCIAVVNEKNHGMAIEEYMFIPIWMEITNMNGNHHKFESDDNAEERILGWYVIEP